MKQEKDLQEIRLQQCYIRIPADHRLRLNLRDDRDKQKKGETEILAKIVEKCTEEYCV